MDGKQYTSKVRNKVLDDFDWLSQWKQFRFRTLLSQTKMLRVAFASPLLFRIIFIICVCLSRFTK